MNMRRFCVSAALLLTTLLAVAENNPYRSDVFWVTVPDHADWLYKTGEQANVEVQFYKYGIPGDNIAINFEIGGEMMPADTKGTVIMRKGKATIPVGTMKKPGFRDCRLTTTVDGKKYSITSKWASRRKSSVRIPPCLPTFSNSGRTKRRNWPNFR